MDSKLKKGLDSIVKKVSEHAVVAKAVAKSVGKDIETLISLGEEKVEQIIDQVSNDKKLNELGSTVFQYAKEGKDAVKTELKKKYDSYNSQMNETVKTKPNVVGFWDGFANAYLATPCERRPKSQIYNVHTTYGKAAGYASAFVIFTPASAVRAVVGALPILTRTTTYLQKKVAEVKQEKK